MPSKDIEKRREASRRHYARHRKSVAAKNKLYRDKKKFATEAYRLHQIASSAEAAKALIVRNAANTVNIRNIVTDIPSIDLHWMTIPFGVKKRSN